MLLVEVRREGLVLTKAQVQALEVKNKTTEPTVKSKLTIPVISTVRTRFTSEPSRAWTHLLATRCGYLLQMGCG